MSLRELVVLGTASQVPTRYRNHNGYFLRFDDQGLLFDPGDGIQRQMVFADVTATSVNRVLITHFHGDHCLGFAGISQRFSLDRVPHPIHVHFPASGQVYYDRLRQASIYHKAATLVPEPIHAGGVIFEDSKYKITALALDHGVDAFGYRFEEKSSVTMLPEKLESFGVRGRAIKELQQQGHLNVDDRIVHLDEVSIPKRGQIFAFVMDTRVCPAAYELAQDADMAVIESTFLESEAQEAHEYGHMTAKQAASIARDANVRQLVLSHFSQRYPTTEPFFAEASPIHPNVIVARDGKRILIPKRSGSLSSS